MKPSKQLSEEMARKIVEAVGSRKRNGEVFQCDINEILSTIPLKALIDLARGINIEQNLTALRNIGFEI